MWTCVHPIRPHICYHGPFFATFIHLFIFQLLSLEVRVQAIHEGWPYKHMYSVFEHRGHCVWSSLCTTRVHAPSQFIMVNTCNMSWHPLGSTFFCCWVTIHTWALQSGSVPFQIQTLSGHTKQSCLEGDLLAIRQARCLRVG